MGRMFWNCWNGQKEEMIDIGDAWVFMPVNTKNKDDIIKCVRTWMSARKTVKMLGLQETKIAEAESGEILRDIMNMLARMNTLELCSLYTRYESGSNLCIDYAFYKAYWNVNVNKDPCYEQKEDVNVRNTALATVQ